MQRGKVLDHQVMAKLCKTCSFCANRKELQSIKKGLNIPSAQYPIARKILLTIFELLILPKSVVFGTSSN